MNARHVPVTATAAAKVADQAGSPRKLQSRFDFRNLFMPQTITLKFPGAIEPAPNLPESFVLTPTIQGGNIDLSLSHVEFFNPPQILPIWTVLQAMISNDAGVSLVLVAGKDVLILSGSSHVPEHPTASGTWFSTLSPQHGTWDSAVETDLGNLPKEFFWTFLFDPDSDNTDDGIQTVIFGFEKQADHSYKMTSSIPSAWKAMNLALGVDGVSLEVTDGNETYCLGSGTFSGALGALVCGGRWNRLGPRESCADHSPPKGGDGGTWTGTSGGPIPPPPPGP